MRGLTIAKSDGRGRWLLAAWHSPHSLTWRWFVDFNLFGAGRRRAKPFLWTHRSPDGLLQWGVLIPWVGVLHFQQQRSMWFRDLYMRLRDEQDQREGLLWLNDRHPHKIHDAPPPSATSVLNGPATLQ